MVNKLKLSEANLKSLVDDYLTYQENLGHLVFLRLNAGNFIELRGQTRRRIKGCPAGTSDYLILTNNGKYDAPDKFECIPIFIELKSATGRQSVVQKWFQEKVERQGAYYFVIHDLEELERILGDDKKCYSARR